MVKLGWGRVGVPHETQTLPASGKLTQIRGSYEFPMFVWLAVLVLSLYLIADLDLEESDTEKKEWLGDRRAIKGVFQTPSTLHLGTVCTPPLPHFSC